MDRSIIGIRIMDSKLTERRDMLDHSYGEASKVAGTLGLVGLFIGIGQLFASTENLTMRIIIGRALSSAGLGASSAVILVWVPDVPMVAQFGLAALFASLGTSGLERLFQKFLNK